MDFENKKITESSKKLYLSNLKRLNGGNEITDLDFLKDEKHILEKLEKYKPNTKRNYIISIVSFLKDKDKDLYNLYYPLLEQFNKDLKIQNIKSDSQKENWLDDKEMEKVFESFQDCLFHIQKKKKIDQDEYNLLLSFVILCLYTMTAPRRNKDYQDMLVIKKAMPDLSTEYNYLDFKNKKFIFNNYKTKGTYKTQVIDIPENLFEVLKLYLKYHPKKKDDKYYLLTLFNGEHLNQVNSITRILNKIFGRKIGVSMLRNMYLTNKYGDKIEELQTDATDMGTSSNTALNNYIKIETH